MKKSYFEKYVEKSNEVFKAATKAEKRVMIAKDTILRIRKGNLEVQTGTLVEMQDDTQHPSFKDYINGEYVNCEVCAKGALFCSFVGRVNKMSTKDVISSSGNEPTNNIHLKLKSLFSIKQLDMIETVFEGDSLLGTLSNDEEEKCYNFTIGLEVKGIYEEDDKLIAICKNIIKNEGTFIP